MPLLLTSSWQNEVTNWAIGSINTNHSRWKYKEIEKIYPTNRVPNDNIVQTKCPGIFNFILDFNWSNMKSKF